MVHEVSYAPLNSPVPDTQLACDHSVVESLMQQLKNLVIDFLDVRLCGTQASPSSSSCLSLLDEDSINVTQETTVRQVTPKQTEGEISPGVFAPF
jgi:hypothetical protein